jgi:hypothetical protein
MMTTTLPRLRLEPALCPATPGVAGGTAVGLMRRPTRRTPHVRSRGRHRLPVSGSPQPAPWCEPAGCVGPVGLEPTTRGLKVRCSAS